MKVNHNKKEQRKKKVLLFSIFINLFQAKHQQTRKKLIFDILIYYYS